MTPMPYPVWQLLMAAQKAYVLVARVTLSAGTSPVTHLSGQCRPWPMSYHSADVLVRQLPTPLVSSSAGAVLVVLGTLGVSILGRVVVRIARPRARPQARRALGASGGLVHLWVRSCPAKASSPPAQRRMSPSAKTASGSRGRRHAWRATTPWQKYRRGDSKAEVALSSGPPAPTMRARQ